MFGLEQLDKLWSNLLALGAKRLAALGIVALRSSPQSARQHTISAVRISTRSIPA